MDLDWPTIVSDLEQLLKLRSIPFGMKLFVDRAEMEAIPRIRRPQHVHTLDQVVGQALATFKRIQEALPAGAAAAKEAAE